MQCPECGETELLEDVMHYHGYHVWQCRVCYTEWGVDMCDSMSYTEVAMMHEGERHE